MPTFVATSLQLLLVAVTSFAGAYVGLKVGIARLEVWKVAAEERIKELERARAVHNDDLLTFDIEIETIANQLSIPRARRQRIRD